MLACSSKRVTARLYEDLGLLTADPVVAEDVNHLFNSLSGYSIDSEYERLLVAPHALRSGIVERIHGEIENHQAGRPAAIRFKMNSLVDEGIIDALYDASIAGVPVDLWIRGICCLRPGVPKLSENIRVRSTLGRFLEHSRILAFQNDDDPEYWIGSADLMHRNLDRRVETMVRLGSPAHETELRAFFDLAFDDQVASWHLQPDSTWVRVHKDDAGRPLADLQEIQIEQKSRRRAAA